MALIDKKAVDDSADDVSHDAMYLWKTGKTSVLKLFVCLSFVYNILCFFAVRYVGGHE